MEQLIKQIEQWAEDRNIIEGTKPIDQAMKLFSEFGELADNVGKGRDCRDDIGDVFVVLTIMAKQQDLDIRKAMNYDGISFKSPKHGTIHLAGCLEYFVSHGGFNSLMECLESLDCICHSVNSRIVDCVTLAYNDIKNRKGVVYNGLFIKESDPAYKEALIKLGKSQ